LVPLVLWWILNQRIGYDYPPTPSHHNATKKIYRSPAAWAMTAFFGLQSTQVYAQFGWLPQIYRDAGVGSTEAGLLLASTVGIGVLSAIGYLGLLWWPADARWIWAILLGIAGMAFPTSISLLPARSVDPDVTARLSGFVQPVGYILAGVGPLVIGALYTASNSWTTSLLVLLTLTLLMAIAGALSSRNINVDDQL